MFKFNFFREKAQAVPAAPVAHAIQPLAEIPAHTPVTLTEILGERKERHRLTELGLVPGVHIEILQNRGGALLVAVRDTRLALGRAMAGKILVQS